MTTQTGREPEAGWGEDYAAPWFESGIASVYDRDNNPVADVFGAGEGGTRDRVALVSKAYLIPRLEAALRYYSQDIESSCDTAHWQEASVLLAELSSRSATPLRSSP